MREPQVITIRHKDRKFTFARRSSKANHTVCIQNGTRKVYVPLWVLIEYVHRVTRKG